MFGGSFERLSRTISNRERAVATRLAVLLFNFDRLPLDGKQCLLRSEDRISSSRSSKFERYEGFCNTGEGGERSIYCKDEI